MLEQKKPKFKKDGKQNQDVKITSTPCPSNCRYRIYSSKIKNTPEFTSIFPGNVSGTQKMLCL